MRHALSILEDLRLEYKSIYAKEKSKIIKYNTSLKEESLKCKNESYHNSFNVSTDSSKKVLMFYMLNTLKNSAIDLLISY